MRADIVETAAELLELLRGRGLRVATAESCTGGLIAAALTEVSGSSHVFDCGFVTYSNAAKTRLLAVPEDLIARHGAVSEPVARAMARGAIGASEADVAVAVTGIAGPGGGSERKPVGLVHVAVALKDGAGRHRECRFGDIGRHNIRAETVAAALALVREAVAG